MLWNQKANFTDLTQAVVSEGLWLVLHVSVSYALSLGDFSQINCLCTAHSFAGELAWCWTGTLLDICDH